MSRHLLSDAAWEAAQAALQVVAPCLRPEERKDAFHEIYDRILPVIQQLDERIRRELKRLGPSNN